MTFGNAEVTKNGKGVFNLKTVMLLNFIVIKLQTIANMKVCIYFRRSELRCKYKL